MASMSRGASFTDEGRDTWGINDCGLKIISTMFYIWRWGDNGVGNGFYQGRPTGSLVSLVQHNTSCFISFLLFSIFIVPMIQSMQ